MKQIFFYKTFTIELDILLVKQDETDWLAGWQAKKSETFEVDKPRRPSMFVCPAVLYIGGLLEHFSLLSV